MVTSQAETDVNKAEQTPCQLSGCSCSADFQLPGLPVFLYCGHSENC